jgi:pimeloyl-ACP methyl ester carboxylesterase
VAGVAGGAVEAHGRIWAGGEKGVNEFLRWRGHSIRVTERGEGEPLFLVPGLGCNAEMWTPFMEQFPHRRLISFDAPGAGRSSTPHYPVSVESLAALAVAVLDQCQVSCTDVVGYSYGGAIAQQLAYDHPARVARLVLA